MRALLLSDLSLTLRNLLDDKEALLLSFAVGRVYHPRLVSLRVALGALPPVSHGSRPFAERIAEIDARHDAFGGALWFYAEAVLRAPDASTADREAIMRIRDAFVPRLSVLRESYATEAARAHDNRARMASLAGDLSRFPLPGAMTLATWVEGFVAAGEALGERLSARADLRALASTEADRRGAGQLRAEILGMLTRLRISLADELAGDPAAAREADAALFSFVDELAARREESLRRRTSYEEVEEVEESAANDVPEATSAAS